LHINVLGLLRFRFKLLDVIGLPPNSYVVLSINDNKACSKFFKAV